MYGTLAHVDPKQCIETPVCENLMTGLAMGMTFEGYKPVLCFERHDFMLIALDAIINHMYMLPKLSGGQFKFPVIIRAIVGHDEPLDPGIQHLQEYTDILLVHTDFVVRRLMEPTQVRDGYREARASKDPTVLVEYKSFY